MISLYKKTNYINKEIRYLRDTNIYEYDMVAGGTVILYYSKLISEGTFKYLISLDKFTRNVHVGNLLLQNPSWNKIQVNGFKDAIKVFMSINKLDDDDVLSINKDSITIINKKCNNLYIYDGLLEFRLDGKYNNYMNLYNKEIYCSSKDYSYNTRNFSNKVLLYQEDYFISFIISSIIIDNNSSKQELFLHFKNFRSNFLNRKLDDNYYYDLDEEGYIINLNGMKISTDLIQKDKFQYNIYNNYNYLVELGNILMTKDKG